MYSWTGETAAEVVQNTYTFFALGVVLTKFSLYNSQHEMQIEPVDYVVSLLYKFYLRRFICCLSLT